MSDETNSVQLDLFETEAARSMLDQLLSDSLLYTKSKDYQELLDFTSRLRNFAPFNAMVLNIQKPGLGYAASARDWRVRFDRYPRQGARPLLILWPFGPVALVYDVMDTEGAELPEDVSFFRARGPMDSARMTRLTDLLKKKGFTCEYVDAGDRHAGCIRKVFVAGKDADAHTYIIQINKNHEPAVQFVTLTHELGHLFLGHLGSDKGLKIQARRRPDYCQREIEAESVACILCQRNEVKSKSQVYLRDFVNKDTTIDTVDIYKVMLAAGQVEALLGLAEETSFDRPQQRPKYVAGERSLAT